MSPIRREDDKIQSIQSWESWVDQAIAEAQERGEFDDLPGAGKPLRIDENPFAGDWETAFHMLENAGMAPYWLELSKEMRAAETAMAEVRERTARYLAEQLALLDADAPPVQPAASRWWPFRRARARDDRPARWRPWPSRSELEAVRQRARRDYLRRTAELDEKIAAYNAWLPDNLRWLERPRLTADRAAREFDAACPPIADRA